MSATGELAALGPSTILFAGNDGTTGDELWVSDGASSGATLLKDIMPGSNGSAPANFTVVGTTLYFTAADAASGTELWKTDGTANGTMLVKDIRAGSSGSYPTNLTAVGSTLYFTANDGASGVELWATNGTAAGTYRVRDIHPGVNYGSEPSSLTAVGSTLYFAADDGVTGRELWKTDGTESGTVQVANIYPLNPDSGYDYGSNPANLKALGSTLYFAANDGSSGIELWESNGTAEGTVRVKDIYAGSSSAEPQGLTALGSAIFFSATNGTAGRELWKTDGTTTGTLLVKDISPETISYPWFPGGYGGGGVVTNTGSYPENFTAVGSALFFTAATTGTGAELWRTDGTEGGTVLVHDINPTFFMLFPSMTMAGIGSAPSQLTAVGGKVMFFANNGSAGRELWSSDGTSSGTALVKDIGPAGDGADFGPRMIAAGTSVFFTANDGGGRKLWKSDGTAAGTMAIAYELAVTPPRVVSTSGAEGGIVSSGTVSFEATFDRDMATSDLNVEDVVLVRDDQPIDTADYLYYDPSAREVYAAFYGVAEGSYEIRLLSGATAFRDTAGNLLDGNGDGIGGDAFVRSFKVDVDAVGAASFPSFTAIGPAGSQVSQAQATGLLHDATDTDTFAVWLTAGQRLSVVLSAPGAMQGRVEVVSPDGTTVLGSDTADAAGGVALVQNVAATADGSYRIRVSTAAAAGSYSLQAVLGSLVEQEEVTGVANGGIATAESITAGSIPVAGGGDRLAVAGRLDATTDAADVYSFTMSAGQKLNLVVATQQGTAPRLELLDAGGTPLAAGITRTEGQAIAGFVATVGGTYYARLSQPSGTSAYLLLATRGGDARPVGPVTAAAQTPVALGSLILFAGFDERSGMELWSSDGTSAEATLVKDIMPGSGGSNPGSFTVVDSTLYFTATDTAGGRELWKTDGTAAGTVRVKDIAAGASGSDPSNLIAVGSLLYFTAYDYVAGTELWKTDGTEAGTVRVKDIRSGGSSSSPSGLAALGSTVYFRANDGSSGMELWKSDGSAAGTVRVKDIYAGSSWSDPQNLTVVGSNLFFSAYDPVAGRELWTSDGTETGTVRVKDIRTGSYYGYLYSSSPGNLTAVGSTLYFTAFDGSSGVELWKSDGTEAGTVRVKDIYPGGNASSPSALTALGSSLAFFAYSPTSGRELWTTDGTESGTQLVKEISEFGGTYPTVIGTVGSEFYFFADDGVAGLELWKTDGTADGTVRVKDLRSGGYSATPTAGGAVMGSEVFFVADAGERPLLWKTDGTEAGTSTVASETPLVFTASAAAPLDGASVTIFPSTYRIAFTQNVLLTSVTADDLRINGTPATGVTVIDGRTLEFTIAGAGAGNGVYTATIAADAITSIGGQSLGAFSASLTVEGAPRVTATSIAEGAAVAGSVTFTATFSKDMATTNLGYEDVTLLQSGGYSYPYYPSSFSYDAATRTVTVRYDYLSEGSYQLSLLAGASAFRDVGGVLLDGNGDGVPGDAFVRNFVVDVDAAGAVALGLGSLGPYTSRARQARQYGTWHAGDTDTSSIALSAGQRVSVELQASGTPQGKVELIAPDGTTVLATDTADAAGAVAWLQNVAVAQDGTYLIRVSSVAAAGSYLLDVFRNAGLEEESLTALGNGDAASAQDIEGSETPIPGFGDHLAVAGRLDAVDTVDVYAFTLAAGETATLLAGPRDTYYSSAVQLQLVDSAGVTVAQGAPGDGGYGQAVRGFTAATAGTYYARVFLPSSSGYGDEYALFVTRATGSAAVTPVVLVGSDTAALGSRIFFAGSTPSVGAELFASDGSSAEAVLVKDITPGSTGSSLSRFTAVGSNVFFVKSTNVWFPPYSYTIQELWQTDGTEPGTSLVKSLGTSSSYFFSGTDLVAVGDALFFTTSDGTAGRELWKTDGTAAGTVLVKDIVAGTGSSAPRNLTAVGNELYFTAQENPSSSERRLWKTDGTETGTVRVVDVPLSSYGGYNIAAVGSTVYFVAPAGALGEELWKTDGTAAGTELVKDINPGGDAEIAGLTAIGSVVYFSASDGSTGRELWKSDGTPGGTVLVRDINVGAGGSYPWGMFLNGSTVYFTANDGVSGRELWKTDGTQGGTELVKDIRPGVESSDPAVIATTGATLFLSASDGVSGSELWKTDGTASGTLLVKDLNPGGASSYPDRWPVADGPTFHFTASDAVGQKLWTSDGTSPGTTAIAYQVPIVFEASALDPVDGAVRGTVPTTYRVGFNQELLLPTVAAGDFLFNGIPATGVTVVDGRTLEFTLAPTTLASGGYVATIAAGAITSVSGLPLPEFSASVTIDATPPRVVSTSVAEGGVVAAGSLSFTAQFDEDMDASGLGVDDVSLTRVGGGAISASSITYDDATRTATIGFTGLRDGVYEVRLLPGSTGFRDLAGNPLDGNGDGVGGDAFVRRFNVDAVGATAAPAWAPLGIQGGLVITASGDGVLHDASDVDVFTAALVAGQQIAVVLTPAAGLRGRLEVIAPDGTTVVANVSAALAGLPVVLQDVVVPVTGTYQVRVSGVASAGTYTLQAYRNTAVETEDATGTSNGGTATAEGVGGSAIPLPGAADRLAVVGKLQAADDAADVFAFTLAAGQTATLVAGSADGPQPLLQVLDASGAVAAQGVAGATNVGAAIRDFKAVTAGTYFARLSLASGTASYMLVVTRGATFDIEPNDAAQDVQQLAGTATVLGFISGGSAPAMSFEIEPNDNGIAGFQTADTLQANDLSGSFTATGTPSEYAAIVDGVISSGSDADWDFFRVVAGPGDRFRFNLDGVVVSPGGSALGDPILRFYGRDGSLLADNDDYFLANSYIDYTLSSSAYTGEYYIVADSFSNYRGGYRLTARLTTAAPKMNAGEGDSYALTAAAGATLTVVTTTPSDEGMATPLDPTVNVYDSIGTLVASNDNGAEDGRNASLVYSVPEGGGSNYRVEVRSAAGTTGAYTLWITGAVSAGGFSATAVAPSAGAVLTANPASYRVAFDRDVLLTSVQAGDVQVNGTAASGFTIIDGRTLEFTIANADAGDGTYAVTIPAGAITSTGGDPLAAFAATMRVEAGRPPRVVATSLAEGAAVALGGLTFTATFNEDMAVSGLGVEDVTLMLAGGGSVTADSLVYDAATKTVSVSYANLVEGSYELRLISAVDGFRDLAGNLLDGQEDGTAGGDFVRIFSVGGGSQQPTLGTSGTLSGVSTTYGTASGGSQLTVTGANLTAAITASAPSGFEVSSDGTTFATTATFTPVSGAVTGTLWVRLAAMANVGTYSGDVTFSSTGATNVTAAMPSSAVSAKALTVRADDKTKGVNAANPALTATITGFVNGETAATALTGAAALATTAVQASPAGSYPITVGPGTLAANGGNYTFSFVAGTLTVTDELVWEVAGGQTATDASIHTAALKLVKRGAGTLVIDQANSHSGGTVVEAGEVIVRSLAGLGTGGLVVRPGAKVTLDVGPGTVPLGALDMHAGGLLDVGYGRITLPAGTFDVAAIRERLTAGYGEGSWAGAEGIASSAAAAEFGRAVGHAVDGEGNLVIGFAAFGDLNVDGIIDFDDIVAFSSASLYDTGLPATWDTGDFDYNGIVDFDDVVGMTSVGLFDTGSYLPEPPRSSARSTTATTPAPATATTTTDDAAAEPAAETSSVTSETQPLSPLEAAFAALAGSSTTEEGTTSKKKGVLYTP